MIKVGTGKSLSEAFILASTNPKYDKRLFIDLPVQYVKTTSSEHGENMLCTQIVFSFCFDIQNNWCTQHVLPMFSELVVFMYWTSESMNNLLSYCGLVDQRGSASDKDLPVQRWNTKTFFHIAQEILHYQTMAMLWEVCFVFSRWICIWFTYDFAPQIEYNNNLR